MLASAQHRFVFLCLPDEVSVAVEEALRRHADIRLGGRFRHLRYADYRRLVRPMLEHALGERVGEVRVFCVFREPLEHLYGAYSARKAKGQIDAGIAFEAFAQAALRDDAEKAYRVPRQSRFVMEKTGLAEDLALFRADDVAGLAAAALSERVGRAVALDGPVASVPRPPSAEIETTDLDMARHRLRRGYVVFDGIARRG